MDKLRLRGKVLNKTDILNNPEGYRAKTILCFEVDNKGILKAYLDDANIDHQTLTLEDWGKEPGAKQIKLFFSLVGRLAEHWHPGRKLSRREKDEVYRIVVGMMDLVNEYGVAVDSISDLDTRELSGAIDMLKDWLLSEGVDISYLKEKE